MYKFRYGFMKDNVNIFQLMYSATDSFIFETIGENFNELMQKHNDFFYLSYFPKGSQYFCNDNKKVPAKMRDEYGGKIIYETTILKSKIYSIRTVDKNEKIIHKGRNSFIRYDEYEDTCTNKKVINNTMSGIKSKNQEIFTYEINKRSLCDFDAKRYILADGINTLAYGHFIKN